MGDSHCYRRSVRSRRPQITDTLMTDVLWLQMSGAIAGGLVGSFAGFLASIIRARLEFRRHRHSVASAIMGELQALREHVSVHYLVRLDNIDTKSAQLFPY